MLQAKLEHQIEIRNEPELQKKVKTNRGRPKISTKTVISRIEKEYLEKQTELVRLKFCFIDRKEVPLTTQQTSEIIKKKFSEEMFDLFVQITQIKEKFFKQLPDPSDPNFKDNSDFGQLIDHFNQKTDQLDVQTIEMVFLSFLTEDLDETGVLSVIETIKQFGEKISQNDGFQKKIPKYKLQSQQFFEQLCYLIAILKNSLQTQLASYQEKLKTKEKQKKNDQF